MLVGREDLRIFPSGNLVGIGNGNCSQLAVTFSVTDVLVRLPEGSTVCRRRDWSDFRALNGFS